jgi:hypothetical protein
MVATVERSRYVLAMEADPYGIPYNVLGPLDPELPALIGRVVMLAALLEARVSSLRSGLAQQPEADFAGLQVGTNLTACRKRAVALDGRLGELGPSLSELLDRLEDANTLRNELVHRVWAQAGLREWAGWKPLPARKRDSPAWTDWRPFSRDQLAGLVDELLALITATTDMYNAVSFRLQSS